MMRALNDVPTAPESETLLSADSSERSSSHLPESAALSALTVAQHRVLNGIEAHVALHGYPPSLRELVDAVGLSKSVVVEKLEALVRLGYIRRDPGVDRGLVVLVSGSTARVIELRPMKKTTHVCERCRKAVAG